MTRFETPKNAEGLVGLSSSLESSSDKQRSSKFISMLGLGLVLT